LDKLAVPAAVKIDRFDIETMRLLLKFYFAQWPCRWLWPCCRL